MTGNSNYPEWRRKYDEEQRIKREQERAYQQEIADQEWNDKVRTLQSKYKCRICGVLPTEPRTTIYWDAAPVTDWDSPGDLERCRCCGYYACNQHFHDKYCIKCIDSGAYKKPRSERFYHEYNESILHRIWRLLFG
jgi:hypothetical protein